MATNKKSSRRATQSKVTSSRTKRSTAKSRTPAKKKTGAKRASAPSSGARSKEKRTVVPPSLTTAARRKLLKPKDQFVEVVEKTARALRSRREMKVPNVTAAKLESLTAKAVRAAKREMIAREQFEKKIRPLSDGRLLAEDAAYRALLDVYAAVKLYARSSPAIGEEFAFLTEHLTFSRERPEPAPAPAPEPTPQP